MPKAKPTPVQLTANLGPIARWLRSKRPRQIVARNVKDDKHCLGAVFLQESGYPEASVGIISGFPDHKRQDRFELGPTFGRLICAAFVHGLDNSKSLTAAKALTLLARVKAQRK